MNDRLQETHVALTTDSYSDAPIALASLDDTPQLCPKNRLVESWDSIRSCKDGTTV